MLKKCKVIKCIILLCISSLFSNMKTNALDSKANEDMQTVELSLAENSQLRYEIFKSQTSLLPSICENNQILDISINMEIPSLEFELTYNNINYNVSLTGEITEVINNGYYGTFIGDIDNGINIPIIADIIFTSNEAFLILNIKNANLYPTILVFGELSNEIANISNTYTQNVRIQLDLQLSTDETIDTNLSELEIESVSYLNDDNTLDNIMPATATVLQVCKKSKIFAIRFATC